MKINILAAIACTALLSACPLVYHAPVQQGNVITPGLVEQLKLGMDQEEVRELLGTPLLSGAMQGQHWYYIEYTLSSTRQASIRKLKLTFLEGKLQAISRIPPIKSA